MLKQKINLRMANQNATPIVNLVQNDTGREIECNILDFDIPAGATSKLWLIKPSGKVASCNGTISGNVVTVALTDQAVAEKGMCVAQLKITKNGKTLSSFTMHFNFEEDASTNGIISQEDIKLVETFIAEQKKKLDAYISEKTKDIEKLKTDVGTLSNDLTTLRNDHSTDIESLEQNSAPPIILTATGESIVLEDSAERRVQGLRIFGKTTQVQTNGYQLFDASKLPSKTAGGATVTNNGDGSFTVSGSGNLTETFSVYYELSHEETIQILKAGRISVANNTAHPSLCAYLYYDNYRKYYSLITDTIKYTDITDEMLPHPDCVLRCYMYGDAGKAIKPGTIKPMLYQTGDETWESYTGGKPSPSPDYPHEIKSAGDAGEIKTGIYGRNLFNITGIKSHTENGITVTINDDQSFTITGKGSHNFYSRLIIPHEEFVRMFRVGGLKLKAINLNGTGSPSPKPYFSLYRSTGNTPTQIGETLYNNGTYDIKQEHLDNENVYAEIGMYAWSGFTTAEGTFKAILYQDGDGTWEPYKPLQSLSLQTPNGLPGIKVDSGGNYTDSTGQQWICDEIDLKRGKYVQRVNTIKITEMTGGYNGKNFYSLSATDKAPGSLNIMCSHYKASNAAFGEDDFFCRGSSSGNDMYIFDSRYTNFNLLKTANPDIKFLYVKETPIERDLAPEEIEAYKALHTNNPTTIISNDKNAGMEVYYIADTQKYIDNKFAEMNKAVVATQKALL